METGARLRFASTRLLSTQFPVVKSDLHPFVASLCQARDKNAPEARIKSAPSFIAGPARSLRGGLIRKPVVGEHRMCRRDVGTRYTQRSLPRIHEIRFAFSATPSSSSELISAFRAGDRFFGISANPAITFSLAASATLKFAPPASIGRHVGFFTTRTISASAVNEFDDFLHFGRSDSLSGPAAAEPPAACSVGYFPNQVFHHLPILQSVLFRCFASGRDQMDCCAFFRQCRMRQLARNFIKNVVLAMRPGCANRNPNGISACGRAFENRLCPNRRKKGTVFSRLLI